MSALAKLKLVATVKPSQQTLPIIRRMKLAGKVQEQIALAEAFAKGEAYMPERVVTERDPATGERVTSKVNKKVRQWWFVDGKRVCLNVKYGSRTLEIAKGKSTIEVASSEELIAALKAVHIAVLQGELDEQIATVSANLRKNFRK
jgi:methyl coenzyme M reductase subunit D